MPTLEELAANGSLVRIGGNLRSYQQGMRRLYAVPEVVDWMRKVLPTATSDGHVLGASHPREQLMDLCNRFVSGEEMVAPLPHPMRPNDLGIYRFKTADLRLNGWFPEKFCFVIGSIELKSNCVNDPSLDDALRDRAAHHRDALQANGGAYLLGDYHDHL